ncbi:MAG: LamG-like jellyroll fold domain-containing protein [Luteolibacter sp.]
MFQPVFPRTRIDFPVVFFRVLMLCGAWVAPADADLTNRWSFNQAVGAAAAGVAMTDSVSSATATVQGNGSTFTGAGLTITGGTTGNRSKGFISGYVDLPNGIISSKTNLTVEVWATPVSAKANARVFDFGRVTGAGFGGGAAGEIIDVAGNGQTPGSTTGSDNLVLNFCVGNTLASQRLEARLDGGSISTVNSALATTATTQYHYVMTFEDGAGTYGAAGGRMTWYRNGTAVGTGDVAFHLSAIEDVNNWLGRSQWADDNNANATYNELRIYNHALTTSEIAADFAAGPDTIPSAPVPAPTPSNVWTFSNQASSSVSPGMTFTDSVGGTVATLCGNGASLTGTALNLPGNTTGNQTASAISAYLDLPNGLVSAQPGISVEAWATPLSSKTWQRLFDFGRTGSTVGTGAAAGEIIDGTAAPGAFAGYDNISLTLNTAGVLGSYQIEGQINNGAAVYSSTTAATTAGTQYHFVLVVQDGVGTYGASGCQARWYRNGVLQNSLSLAFHLTSMSDVNNWIGRSQYAGDSNSNLSLNELRFYNRAITAAEVTASYSAGPDPTSGPPEPPVPAPNPLNRWSFNNPSGTAATGTAFTDSASGVIATLRGNGATLSGTALVLPGTTNGNQTAAAISAYLDLPNGIISSKPSLTFEAWATPLSSKTWQRIFDFGRSSLTAGTNAATGEIIDGAAAPGAFTAYDNLLLSLNNNGMLGSHRLEGRYNGGTTITSDTDLSSITTAGTEYHYVLTVQDGAGAYGSSGCQAKWYRNGAVQGSIDLNYRITQMADVNNWIGRSMWAADMNSNIALNELRIYDRAITSQEVSATYTAGANVVYPAPVTTADSATIHAGQKVRIAVLDNDTGLINRSSLQIVSPPSVGTATVDTSTGEILYAHSGTGTSPVTFTYRVFGEGGVSPTATVTINIATTLRITNPSLAMPAAPPVNTWQLVDALPGLTFTEPLCIASLPGDTKRLFVCERMAKIQHIADVTATTPVKNVFLDLQAVVAGRTPAETIEGGGNNEHGLLGLAFHPNYASNGYFYAAYTVRISAGSYYQRISRFKVSSTDATVADPTSERVLLQQLDEGPNHDGGDLHFGPNDGYLYYTAGDEENPADTRLNSQKINKDFFSGIFRIDVDKKPGNLEPNAAIPTDGGIARFSVPIDNPFVHTSFGGTWNGTYNGNTVTPLTGVRTEFWATGLRHTWRFSFDSSTGEMWGGDVGQDTYEEVNKIVKGGNYGWVWREGKHDTAFTNPVSPAKPAGFTSSDPIYEYVHAAIAGDALYKGNSVVGGYVYRGTRFPALVGTYVFSDSVSGHVWQMDTSSGAVTRLTGLPGAYGVFSAQGEDPSNKDLLFCAYLNGKIMRMTTAASTSDGFPTTLSATGLFSDLSDLSPAPGLLPYEPNLKFWSDYADKRRWFTIPDATGKMSWSKDGNWTYPTGTVWVKHFDLELSRGNPATKKRIETRVIVKTDTGSYGVSYRWNEAQSNANLVADTGDEFDIAIDDHGTARTQRWQIPGRTSCLTCHTPQAGHALSFNTRQLNLVNTINGFTGNQIDLLSLQGFLSNTPDPADTLARHVRPDETQYPLEQRARSYFAVNCSYCHQAAGSVSGFWDGRAHITLEQTGLINGVAENSGGSSLNRYIVPGDTTHSIVLNRMAATNGFGRMPPLGSNQVDPADIQLVTDWINNSLPGRPVYQQWRDGYFAALDPKGDKTADPDGDGVSNYEEYLRGSPPLNGSGSWQATVANGSLQFLRKANRYYSIQTSDGLDLWQSWPIQEFENSYKTTDELIEIPLPASPDGKQFFRFNVSEP